MLVKEACIKAWGVDSAVEQIAGTEMKVEPEVISRRSLFPIAPDLAISGSCSTSHFVTGAAPGTSVASHSLQLVSMRNVSQMICVNFG